VTIDVVGDPNPTVVQASIEMVAAAGCTPEVLVLSGDVANQGEADACVRLGPVIDAALQRFGATLLVAPGNHDDVALLRAHLLGWEPERGPLDEVVHVGGLRVVGTDSSVPGEVHDELDDTQLAALADELAEPAAEVRCWSSIIRRSGPPLRCRSWWRCANLSGWLP
jgi:3',5'-cyclic-AMP phosphodiesterase